MLSLILGWIPILGPIIQGITGIFGKFMDSKVAINQADATRDVEEAKVSAQIIHDTNDDICLRLMRDAVCFPVVVWCMIGGWDTIVAKHWPWLRFLVAEFPPSMSYYPYAVLVFLLGNIGINMWNRK